MINPKNIHCLALNYQGVGNELDECPLYFIKSKLSLCYNGAKVPFPNDASILWTEVELGIIVKEECTSIQEESAPDFIEGFVVCADITCNNLYSRDHHLGYSKSRKHFCPISTTIVNLDSNKLNKLELITEINGKITQRGSTKQMRYNPNQSFCYVSNVVPLWKGDLILTGTPPGHENNMLQRGNHVRHIIELVGELQYEIV